MEDGVYRREQAKIDALEKELLKLQRERALKLAKNKLWKQKSDLFTGALSDLQHQGCVREGDSLRLMTASLHLLNGFPLLLLAWQYLSPETISDTKSVVY